MTNLWAFLLQTLYVTGVGLLLLAIKTLLKDKLSPRWQYAVWAVLALRILLPAYTGKYYVLLPLPLWVETAKVMVEPHWASAYTNVYEATQVTSPIPWLNGRSGQSLRLAVPALCGGRCCDAALVSHLLAPALPAPAAGDARPADVQERSTASARRMPARPAGPSSCPACRPRWCAGCSARCWPCRRGKRWMTM